MMSSHECIVPKLNVRQEKRIEVEGEERNRSSHVQPHQNLTYVVPMCNRDRDVMELTWENGQVALHGIELNPPPPSRSPHDTLESIVHQATTTYNTYPQQHHSSIGKIWDEDGKPGMQGSSAAAVAEQSAKRVRSEPTGFHQVEESACARDTLMTWNSFESSRSLKTARINEDDESLYHECSENQDGERVTKGESCRSQSSARRSRAAAIHNLSERRRRDRINEKMKALQKLVPNASKTDKASMLDEVIEYLKQLQAQLHMMSNARNMPQMMMPLGMQQQLQMSLLARMGMGMNMGMSMGMGMGMLDVNNLTRNMPPSFPPLMHAAAPAFVSPQPFAMPPVQAPPLPPLKANVDAAAAAASTSMPNFNDAYNTFLAQSMNMEFLNKMSALYRQQQSSQQPSKKPLNLSLPNDAQGG